MIKNYLTIAWRNLMKYKLYSFLNIAGLTVGITSFCLIFLFVKDELSYDNYHTKADQTYRINFYGKLGEQTAHTAQTPAPAGPLFKEVLPDIETMCRITSNGRSIVQYENNSFNESHVLFADSTLFEVFNFKLLQGNPFNALKAPGAAIVSATTAKKYFGNSDPMGRTIKLDNDKLYSVTGVMADIPSNTHFKADIFLSMASFEDSRIDNWGSTNYQTYLVLKRGADPKKLSATVTDLFIKNFSFVLKQYLNTTWEGFTKNGNYARLELFPMRDIHLYSNLEDELDVNGNIRYVYIFSIVGLLILALACINFINLTTARSVVRMKEVGVRKTVGAFRSSLAFQFLGESLFLAITAWLFALVIIWLLLPLFDQLAGKQFDTADIFSFRFLLPSLVVASFTGLTAGLYPALFISGFKAISILKGAKISGHSKSYLRSGLVIFQFFITTLLLVSALIIYLQLRFIRNKNLGFNKEQVLTINDGYLLQNNLSAFREKIIQFPAVKSVSVTNRLPVSKDRNNTSIIKGRVASNENTILVNNFWVDQDYVKTFGISIVEGRDLSREITTDSSAVLVNEVLAKEFGYPNKPVAGQELGLPADSGKINPYHIVGVMKDFHFTSLRDKIGPLVIFPNGYANYISIRFDVKDVSSLIQQIGSVWKTMAPGQPFSYNFLNEKFAQIYETETRVGTVINVFTIIAVIIACLGLLGLVIFMAQQRRKEIGIRKVLGAGVFTITSLLAKDFMLLVIIAIALAFPLAYFLMQSWLNDFAYRVDIRWWMFAIVGLAALFVALLTVIFQAIKAALANPVKSLRTE
jgi:putative ABC transport system permease protein